MRFYALATDYDGTIAHHGVMSRRQVELDGTPLRIALDGESVLVTGDLGVARASLPSPFWLN